MPARMRAIMARMRREMADHKITTAVFGVSLAAIVAFGVVAGASSPARQPGSGSGTGSSVSAAQPATGKQAPAFDLAGLVNSGQHVSLAAYAGKPVIVNFFASWCGPCRQETPLMARYYTSAHGAVRVIGVDTNDSRTAALAFTRHYGVTYPVASDPAATTAGTFGVAELPQTFFLNAQHKIVDRVYGAVTQAALAHGVKLMGQPAAAGR
ncbi:MAG TPA: TlpA disulfide reductase family protein [Streptosporangiaceae bacterium]